MQFALFRSGTDAFMQLVRGISDDQWERQGLDQWSVRSLVGHTSRAMVTVIDYVALEEPRIVTIGSAEQYYALATAEYGDEAAIVQRGVDAGNSLGEDPVATLSALAEHSHQVLADQTDQRVVAVRGGSILLTEYLRTRLLELVVHSLDIAAATGQEANLPSEAIHEALLLAAGIAAYTDRGEQTLLALTGRGRLPEGFSVV